jgi:hypothetical protein
MPDPSFPMPSGRELSEMSAPDFITFWTMYRETFLPTLGLQTQQHIRMAIELRSKGWEFWSGPTLSTSRWVHPAKHHSILRIEVAHELDARGWLSERNPHVVINP